MGLIVLLALLLIGGVVCIVLNSKYGKTIHLLEAEAKQLAEKAPKAYRDDGESRPAQQIRDLKFTRRFIFLGIFICLGLAILIFVFSTFRVIAAGHVGVPVLFGKVQDKQLGEGLNVVNPLFSVTQMDCRVQKAEGKYDAASKDMQNVHVIMAINFELIPNKACEVYQGVGLDFVRIIIDPAAQEVLKAHTAVYNASDILQKRATIKTEVQDDLAKWLLKYGVRLREISLANIKFDPDYETAISKKQVEEQKAEQQKYMLIQAQKQAEIVAAAAKGEADAAINRAKGNAESKRIEGDAAEYYNNKVSKSLTSILIQQQYLSRWDGKVPVYQMGGNAGVMNLIPLPQEEKETKK
jgi:regulator of protease activity HflC (stomatin/prohibitin superfamily)